MTGPEAVRSARRLLAGGRGRRVAGGAGGVGRDLATFIEPSVTGRRQ